ncbi:deoxynucleotidyltransferase terminal-interacting protein 1 [Sitodiplosis mosellana]|uniref:deoxynucleotidyltransferase terminal-interacting protein 1 n=1 Tax=Sitodiplosis mosellana TaxID=263140 RepID=UPI002444F8D6|nr:deoxynucleotidyltransferase terminal-interacting protein 1 [Sitodiplosis mosellana]
MVMNTNQSMESFPLQHISSSEDSSSSWQMVTNSMNSSQNSQSTSNGTTSTAKKLQNSELSEVVLKELRRRYNGRSSMNETELETAQQSMNLMRQNVQHLFDNEIQAIVQKYVETYFEPALKNIKENLENSGITDQYLKKMCCDLLENTKQTYKTSNGVTLEPTSSNEVVVAPKPLENNTLEQVFFSYTNAPIKRKDSAVTLQRSQSTDHSPLHKRSPITFQNKCITATRPGQIILSVTLTTDTLFTFDFKVHEAFDYGPNDRLINKYPDLIRYIIDVQDKDWFIQQRILSPIHRTSQIMLFTIEEVNRIAHSDILRNQPYRKPIELLGFKIPEFMLQKMRKFICEHGENSKKIITNTIQPKVSLSALLSATPKPTAIKTIQSIKPILKPQLANTTSLSSMISSMRANSQPTTVLLVDTSGNGSKTATITSAFITSSDEGSINSPVIARSSLSSSHATLSALLSNSPTEKTLNSIVLNEIND